ncbi:hypothetical protein T459_28239 [Capsicum annuum]|uniref:Uncharacterized protein n=1 Tax=Capsicum annuum TaxID=4072 RepID=A0A2G2YG81_CAPAN|nr:hypothetical protein FXO37_31254 [Capsicum annuum]PHT68752.1 hypothetical protein T459_28239 [Capsicum annuum]
MATMTTFSAATASMSTERSFAKIVSSLRTQSSQAKGGGALSSACNAALEISGLLPSFLAWFLLKLLLD